MTTALAKAVLLLTIGAAAEYRRPRPQPSGAQGRLRKQPSGARKHFKLSKGVTSAIFHTLGDSPDDWLVQIRTQLKSAWRSLPRVNGTRVDRHTLRHAVHGHFMHQHGLWIRGLAPSMGSGGSCARDHGQCMWEPAAADALQRVLPPYQDEFSLDDAVDAVVALRRRALAADKELLEAAYRHHGVVPSGALRLDRKKLSQVLTTYTAHWLAGAERPVQDLPRLDHPPDDMGRIQSLIEKGILEAVEDRRATTRDGRSLEKQAPWFSREEAEEAASVVTLTFAKLWEPQCREMRLAISAFDEEDKGVLSIANFHATPASGHWHFTESAEDLREMGALLLPKGRVLLPNYHQAASNCIVSTSEYRVCCMDECVAFARQVELAVHNSSATPKQLLRLAQDLAPETHGRVPSKATAAALQKLATSQGGRVALHGRAYAHWLRIAFPWACPLPRDAPLASAGKTVAVEDWGALAAVASSPQDPAPVVGRAADEGGRDEEKGAPEQPAPVAGRSTEEGVEEEEELQRGALDELPGHLTTTIHGPPWDVREDVLLVLAVVVSLFIALGVSRLRSRCLRFSDAKLHLG